MLGQFVLYRDPFTPNITSVLSIRYNYSQSKKDTMSRGAEDRRFHADPHGFLFFFFNSLNHFLLLMTGQQS